ncbi:MAG: hypothetical protein R3Y36_03800 [Spirochaetales bacterium]
MNIFVILLKKEFTELFLNKKLLGFVCVLALALYATRFLETLVLSNTIILVFVMMIVNQYMFDSCVNDINSGGALFLHNIKAGFLKGFIAKLLCAIALGTFFFIVGIAVLHIGFALIDLWWIIPCFVFVSAFTFLLTIFTQKSDFLNMFINAVVILGILVAAIGIESILFRTAIISALTLCVFVACNFSFKRLSYRVLL